jgi:hypothetical protein
MEWVIAPATNLLLGKKNVTETRFGGKEKLPLLSELFLIYG